MPSNTDWIFHETELVCMQWSDNSLHHGHDSDAIWFLVTLLLCGGHSLPNKRGALFTICTRALMKLITTMLLMMTAAQRPRKPTRKQLLWFFVGSYPSVSHWSTVHPIAHAQSAYLPYSQKLALKLFKVEKEREVHSEFELSCDVTVRRLCRSQFRIQCPQTTSTLSPLLLCLCLPPFSPSLSLLYFSPLLMLMPFISSTPYLSCLFSATKICNHPLISSCTL